MKENLDIRKEIINNHNILYKMYYAPCTETCMCWGLECSDGWLNEIDILSKKLEALNLMLYPQFNVRIQADQVKEKYGTLRWYDFGAPEATFETIRKYCRLSEEICVRCGKHATHVTLGWINYMCKECVEERKLNAMTIEEYDKLYEEDE
jgi:hypothetical protein